ncbi:hypothetical protein GX50_02635 [[Emmonsia] crescens]|uniref:Uncharacterized protein n=1 Tax=[Emmonsia] crescens TaxID=73230 RepID=A0A2B7ZNG9_9EURO|nr:hypothetical protein GX50_02635 [Emmonsia crescens]
MARGGIPKCELKAAAVHAAPGFMDKTATTRKVLRPIEQAAKQDISLPFISGFPVRFEPKASIV